MSESDDVRVFDEEDLEAIVEPLAPVLVSSSSRSIASFDFHQLYTENIAEDFRRDVIERMLPREYVKCLSWLHTPSDYLANNDVPIKNFDYLFLHESNQPKFLNFDIKKFKDRFMALINDQRHLVQGSVIDMDSLRKKNDELIDLFNEYIHVIVEDATTNQENGGILTKKLFDLTTLQEQCGPSADPFSISRPNISDGINHQKRQNIIKIFKREEMAKHLSQLFCFIPVLTTIKKKADQDAPAPSSSSRKRKRSEVEEEEEEEEGFSIGPRGDSRHRSLQLVKETARSLPFFHFWEQHPNRNTVKHVFYNTAIPPGFSLLQPSEVHGRMEHRHSSSPTNREFFNEWMGLPFYIPGLQPHDLPRTTLPCKMFLFHLYVVIANKNPAVFQYILQWLVTRRLKPYLVMGVALVLMGKQGVGKTIFMETLVKLMGSQAGIYLQRSNDLFTNPFATAQYATKSLLCADEIACGDKNKKDQEIFCNNLKTLITCGQITWERKYHDRQQVPSNMGIVLSSNHMTEAIPAEIYIRRALAVEVSNAMFGNKAYFTAYAAHINDSIAGLQSIDTMLHLLGNSREFMQEFNIEDYPRTEFHNSQLPCNKTDFVRWLDDCLNKGKINGFNPLQEYHPYGPSSVSSWPSKISVNRLYQAYSIFCSTVLGQSGTVTSFTKGPGKEFVERVIFKPQEATSKAEAFRPIYDLEETRVLLEDFKKKMHEQKIVGI